MLSIHGDAARDKAIDILKQVGLGNRLRHRPSQLSEGEKKRVDLARAIVREPKFLIADEPFSNLDADSASKVSELLADFISDGGTLVISSTMELKSPFIKKVVRLS